MDDLTIYSTMYLKLFNAVTDAIALLDRKEYEKCREILVSTQIDCEEIYIASDSKV